MAAKVPSKPFRYRCPDCGTVKEFAQRPALPPTCCGNAMAPLQ